MRGDGGDEGARVVMGRGDEGDGGVMRGDEG